MSVPPFTPAWRPRKQPWQPRSFVEAPVLDGELRTAPPVPGEVLLINPFYAKDPHASFGKHVLTPTLALTSIAGATPPGWNARYWDEGERVRTLHKHILTPYPGTPLFRQMEAEGRLLHKNWDLYDTAHCVFRPRHMEPEVLEAGYFWCYERLFSHVSIWQRRPDQPSTALAYLARTYLYKRSNRLWEFVIRHRQVHTVWRPLVEVTRWQRFRSAARLEQESSPAYRGANLLPARGTVEP